MRMRLMWHTMRADIPALFPAAPKTRIDIAAYMKRVEEVYVTDAYHSLSIEGYRVGAELIERVRQDTWNPDNDEQDHEHRNALAARGYHDAFQAVKQSVEKVLRGENPAPLPVTTSRSGTPSYSGRASRQVCMEGKPGPKVPRG